jgi:predicted RNA-binding protein associated with RNAse of E/G family
MSRADSLVDVFWRCKGLGFGKGHGPALVPGYWSDVVPLALEEDVAFFAHAKGMSFHYPKRGFLRRCTVPCLVFVDLRTHAAGYIMKKWRVFDLIDEAVQDDAENPWRAEYGNVASLPLSFYVNVCDPGDFRFDKSTGRLALSDWYVDVVKVVVADAPRLTPEEQNVRADLLAKGLLIAEHDLTLGRPEVPSLGRAGGVRTRVQEFAAELVDVDELENAVASGALTPKQATEALAIGASVLEDCHARRGVFEPRRLERLLEKAFQL